MGLDNIPHVYPCKKAGTAIMTAHEEEPDGRIDCEATRNANRCPWQEAARNRGTPVTGMFGTPCWWRGKVGTFILGELAGAGYDDCPGGVEAFYGDGDASPNLSPEQCREIAAWLRDHAEAYAMVAGVDAEAVSADDLEAMVEEYRYAAWWIGWVAEAADGADAWW